VHVSRLKRRYLALLSCLFVVAAVLVSCGPSRPEPFTATYYGSMKERFGVGLNNDVMVSVEGTERPARITDYDVAALQIGWYSEWGAHLNPPRPGGIVYAQLVWVAEGVFSPAAEALGPTVEANPGSLWIVGNEPESIWQGNSTPQQYAGAYHELHELIKGRDPCASVAIGGVVAPTPLRLQWLEAVLEEYRSRYGREMPVDVWNIHVQILPEKAGDWGADIPVGIDAAEGELYHFSTENGYYDNANPDTFRQLVVGFRQWMQEQGFRNKPLIISEYGVLLPSTYIGRGEGYGDQEAGDRVLEAFMRETFDFLITAVDPELGYPADGNRLVQQWSWYSLNDQPFDETTGVGFNGALFSHLDPGKMTRLGVVFRDYMEGLAE
jgi:hypothetical protein